MAWSSVMRLLAVAWCAAYVTACELVSSSTPTQLPAATTASASPPTLAVTPPVSEVRPPTPLAAARASFTPAASATFQIPPSAPLPLAYSTAEGVFLWNPQTGLRTRIANEPAARLSWATDGAWLAVTRNPFVGYQLDVVARDAISRSHRIESGFAFPVWAEEGGSLLALPCPGTSGRPGDFQVVDPVRGTGRILSTAEVWRWLPQVAPDLSKALIFPFNKPFQSSAIVVFDDWQRAPLVLGDADFPNCPDAYAWSPDSRHLAYYGGGRFWVRDMAEPDPSRKLINGPATLKPINAAAPAMAWSSDGKQIALALEGQLWIAELASLSARRIDGQNGIFSGLSWAPAPRRSTPTPDGVLSRLMPFLNPGEFFSAFVQVSGRPAPRIIATSSEVTTSGPFVYLDYAGRKSHIAPPATRLDCHPFNTERPQAPALRLSSEQTDRDGREYLMVSGGWYMSPCKGTLIYRWDGDRLTLVVETSATAD